MVSTINRRTIPFLEEKKKNSLIVLLQIFCFIIIFLVKFCLEHKNIYLKR